uniref:115 kDa protein in type-1 retrotransposable element R1DM n=1 Tax=Bombyx mori TaxID=7091 RepID=A0A8R2M2X6_BOMMO|nr:uncharacterized protein LOC119629799 [Bombyx mori]
MSWKQKTHKHQAGRSSVVNRIGRDYGNLFIGRTTKRHEDLPLVREGVLLGPRESAELLADTFYPEDKKGEDNKEHKRIRKEAEKVNGSGDDSYHDPPFTPEELKFAVSTFNPKKAPGIDGLTSDICRQAISTNPRVFLSLANKCLELGYFPKIWKEAIVVVLRKPDKENYTEAKSYRPIGLLPVMGKILEKMMVNRIKWHVLPRMSTRQYGFMPQRSTEDSLYDLIQYIREKLKQKKLITMVSLDIEGAFDSAWWPAVRTRLAEERCPINIRRVMDSYLSDRSVRVRYAGEEVTKSTTKGCVQGSIGGPILWNLLLDPLLKELEKRGDYCQAFADDVVLVFDADSALEIQRQANAALAYVRDWGIRNKLTFAPHKTYAMVLTRKLKYDTPVLSMGGVGVRMSKEIKVLGLIIDSKLTFNSHVANICKKALNLYKQLSRAAKISWGLHPDVIRTIYVAVVEPVIMYASSAWASSANKLGVQKLLNAVQRGFAQKLCKSYRTTSLNSALVLAGLLPLDLRIHEAAALYEAKRGVGQLATGDGEMERMTKFADIPHPAKHIDLQFICLEDREQVDTHSTQTVRIYTDGSKIDGKVGASLSFWSNEVETKCKKLKLSSYCTVFQAELLAICRSTREIIKHPKDSFGIYSDSRSSLEAVTNNRSLHPLVVEIRRNLEECKRRNKRVALFWIKAHAGLEGNERADQLAKEAALKLKTKPDYDLCPVSCVRRQIRLGSLEVWNKRYSDGETAATTKLFFPDVIKAYSIVRHVKPSGILTQVMTGHGGFSAYLNRFKCKENPSCICEPEKPETVEHIIIECPVFSRERYDTENLIDYEIKVENICKIVENKYIRDKFLEFCKNVAKKVINRNR